MAQKYNKTRNSNADLEKSRTLEEKKREIGYKFPPEHRFRLSPRTDEELDMLAHDLLLWCQQDEAISLGGFCEISGLPKARMYEAAHKHEGMRNSIDIARQVICNRRERMGLTNQFNAAIVLGTLAMYDPEYRAYKKEMSQKEGQGESKIVVVLDKYPETETVPEKRSHDSD